MKGGTLFSGGGGFCLGMVSAGVEHAWGIELNDDIAAVARMNGLNTMTADILECNPADFEPVDFLHASPPCPNFSSAKTNAEETELDRALAGKVCEFIVELLPRVFTLENVYQYRNSQSWETIARTLLTHGYAVNYWHVNMADYGVPQTRKRMIAIARRDGMTPMLPPATHDEKPQVQLFGAKRPYVSWCHGMPKAKKKSTFTNLQKNRIAYLDAQPPLLIDSQNVRGDKEKGNFSVVENAPCFTVTASWHKGMPRMFVEGDSYMADVEHALFWQSFPASYQINGNIELAMTVIGNAVPPLFAQRLVEWLK